jgi:hypothetical protein
MLGSIICGTASVVVAIGSFFVVTSAIRGPYRFNLALMAALTALGACTFGMVRLFGRNRAAAGVAIGLLVVMLIGCAGLAMTCGNGWHD